jgi:hypothetical protein
MSFIQRELARLGRALADAQGERAARLYAAQQALAWASEPTLVQAPYDFLTRSVEAYTDCSAQTRPVT